MPLINVKPQSDFRNLHRRKLDRKLHGIPALELFVLQHHPRTATGDSLTELRSMRCRSLQRSEARSITNKPQRNQRSSSGAEDNEASRLRTTSKGNGTASLVRVRFHWSPASKPCHSNGPFQTPKAWRATACAPQTSLHSARSRPISGELCPCPVQSHQQGTAENLKVAAEKASQQANPSYCKSGTILATQLNDVSMWPLRGP